MRVTDDILVAGRPLPDEEVQESSVSDLTTLRARLRQRTLFEYSDLLDQSQNTQGRQIPRTDFVIDHSVSIPWGDPVSTGNEVEDADTFRLISHNVNGLSTADQQADVLHFATNMKTKAVAVFGIQETNRNFERQHMLTSFHRAITQVSTHHHGAVSSARMQWPQDHQPGGTAVSVRNKWATRFLDKGSDDLGRWSWLTLAGQGTTKVTFVSAYRVCDGATEAAITSRTVRAQQEWIYADRGLQSVNLRQQFVVDLTAQLLLWKNAGHDLVLMVDANEASGPGSAIERLIYACALTDVHKRETEAVDPPPTHQRGSEKIDFVLVSNRLVRAVKARAVLPLNDGYLSDHRALLVDFDAQKLFAGPTSEVVAPSARQLTSTNPKAVATYTESMLAHIAKHDVLNKVETLRQRSESGQWTEDDTQQWEAVDRIMAQARICSEHKCSKKNSGQKVWSPELKATGETLLYWRLRIREHTSRKSNQFTLDRLAGSCKISAEDVAYLSVPAIIGKIREARHNHKQVKIAAADLREAHMTDQAQFLAALHNMSDVAARAAIATREKSSGQFRNLRQIFKGPRSSGLERLDVPNEYAVRRQTEAIPRMQLVTKEEIEDVLLPHTVQRFRQHHETPFGNGDRSTSLGQTCMSADFDHLQKGTYDRDLDSLSDEAREWLRQLRQKDFAAAGNLISTRISTEDWISGWMKMRESTASAPGGHYGHYKTAATVARLPTDHPAHTRVLAEVYAIMLSLPLAHGFAPERWKYCVDAILEKIPGKPRIEKLRIIMLYEADFNFVLKLIWGRRLIRHAEKYQCIGTSNHGSRSGRQTIDALMEKLLLYEYARLTRTSLITIDNDAKSCYDRIIRSLAMIACVGVGLPILAAAMHNRTHHGMVHSIKTRHGTLRPYSGTDDEPLEGSGQGSGASPAIWLLYSMTLLNAFRKFSPGMQVACPFETLLVTILAVFYVDDGMPGVNDAMADVATPLPILLQQAEESTQAWEKLLFASGGALELSKCFAYVLYWDLSNGQHRLIRPDEIDDCDPEGDHFRGPVGLTYGNSAARNLLETEDPWVGRRTLGVRIAPAGTWTAEYQYRRNQARELAMLVAGSSMSRDTARVGYFMMVCPKLEYPLAVTQFTQKQCDSITSPVLRACLSKMGYNCNMPKEVIYGPAELFGVGCHDYYVEQGVRQLVTLFGHIRQQSATGNMMRIELQWCQVQAGTGKYLLADPIDDIDYIETCWIMSIRDFLRTYGLSIDLTKSPLPSLQAAGDEFLMDAIRQRGDCTATEMQRINACRMFLQVTRVSDITSADGKDLRKECLVGQQHHGFCSSTKWPRQGIPPKTWWRLWNKKLRLVLTTDGRNTRLRRPLGKWDDNMQLAEWRTLCTATGDQVEVYERRRDGMYNLYRNTAGRAGRSNQVDGTVIGTVDSIPTHSLPAFMGSPSRSGQRRVSFRQREPGTTETLPTPEVTSFAAYVATQDLHIRQLLEHADVSDNSAAAVLHQLYTQRHIVAGTDGGLLNDNGTFGYVWANPVDITTLSSGRGEVPGHPVSMSSTRTELCGLFAALTYLRLAMAYYHMVIPRGGINVTIYCDSKAALMRVQDLAYDEFGTTWRCRANYDIESATRHCIKLQSDLLRITWTWVRGHASRRKRPDQFTLAETLNEAADDLATAARDIPQQRTLNHWPEQQISLVGPRGRISGQLAKEIRYCCTAADLESYWQQRYGWSASQARMVDLVGTTAASKGMTTTRARRTQKLRCGWLPVNNRVSRSDPDRPAGCTACSRANLTPETVDHLFLCEFTERRRAILDRFQSFYSTLREWKTSTHIIRALQTGSLAWIEGQPIPDADTLMLPNTMLGRLIRQAYQEQSELGWNVLFRGFWTTTWRLAQEEEFSNIRGRQLQDTSERWAGLTQLWYYDLFELIWGLRNADEHGADTDTQRLIRISKCERAIRRLYDKGEDLPYAERHPFRDSVENLLLQSVMNQELWITKTSSFIEKALKRARARPRGQRAITAFFEPIQG
jgi:ribonuclease HI/exonuclease III